MRGIIRVLGPDTLANGRLAAGLKDIADPVTRKALFGKAELITDTLSAHGSVALEGVALMMYRSAGLVAARGVVIMESDPLISIVAGQYETARTRGLSAEVARQTMHAQFDSLHDRAGRLLRGAPVINVHFEPEGEPVHSLQTEAHQAVGDMLGAWPNQQYMQVSAGDDLLGVASRMAVLL